MSGSSADEVRALMTKKDQIEKDIKELNDVLESQKGIGMDGPLTDDEQFPRSDIDIYSVRHARQNVLRLQNDHKELMDQIEQGLYQVHAGAKLREKIESGASSARPMEVDVPCNMENKAFVRVDRVDQGSPAAEAGLQVDDLVLQFGSISLDNYKTLQDIGKVVQHSIGRPVGVTVCREGKEYRLGLVPKTWSGKGYLGCNIVPLKS